jgi:stage V sporulation protein B
MPERRGVDLSARNRGRNPIRAAVATAWGGGESLSTAAQFHLTIVTTLVILVATLASGIVLARTLGPTSRGILTAAMLFGPLVASIGSLGIAEALVYRSAQEPSGRSPALLTALCIGACQSLILVLAGWIIVPRVLGTSHQSVTPALAYLAFVPLSFLINYAMAVLQGRLRLGQFNLVRALVPILYTAILLLLWHLGAMSVWAALLASLASFGVGCVLVMAAAVPFSSRQISVKVARELLAYGLPTHAGNLATALIAQLDVLVLTALVPSRELGYYAVATSAALVGSLIPVAASMVLFPTFANQSVETVPRSLARFLLWGLGGVLLLAPVLVVVLPWAVVPVYGAAFRPAAAIALILVPGYLFRGASQMLVAILRGSGSPMRASVGQIVGLVALAAMLPVGIADRGIAGAALAVTLSSGVAFVWLLATALRHGRLSAQHAVAVWHSDLTRLRQALRR